MKPHETQTQALCLVRDSYFHFAPAAAFRRLSAAWKDSDLKCFLFVLCGLDINMKYELENCLICLALS